MSSFYRHIRTLPRVRAWYAAKTDRRNWDEEMYSPPPEMRHPGMIILLGSWADLQPSSSRVNRFSSPRGVMTESQNKVYRLHKRRDARKYRAYQKQTGKL